MTVNTKSHKQMYLRRKGYDPKESYSLHELSIISGVKKSILQQVYNRGIGAWKTNPSSVRVKGSFIKSPNMKKYPRSARLGKEQWAYARVYSFLNKGKTWYTADADLADKVKVSSTKRKKTSSKKTSRMI